MLDNGYIKMYENATLKELETEQKTLSMQIKYLVNVDYSSMSDVSIKCLSEMLVFINDKIKGGC